MCCNPIWSLLDPFMFSKHLCRLLSNHLGLCSSCTASLFWIHRCLCPPSICSMDMNQHTESLRINRGKRIMIIRLNERWIWFMFITLKNNISPQASWGGKGVAAKVGWAAVVHSSYSLPLNKSKIRNNMDREILKKSLDSRPEAKSFLLQGSYPTVVRVRDCW